MPWEAIGQAVLGGLIVMLTYRVTPLAVRKYRRGRKNPPVNRQALQDIAREVYGLKKRVLFSWETREGLKRSIANQRDLKGLNPTGTYCFRYPRGRPDEIYAHEVKMSREEPYHHVLIAVAHEFVHALQAEEAGATDWLKSGLAEREMPYFERPSEREAYEIAPYIADLFAEAFPLRRRRLLDFFRRSTRNQRRQK